MHPDSANTFLLGVMLDHSGNAERAWEAAEWICSAVGDSDDVARLWRNLKDMDPPRLRGFLRYGYGGDAFHRFYKTFARLLPEAAEHLLENYEGDPRRIWNNQRDVGKVSLPLDEIPGIGPALAKMAVLILAREHGLLGGKKACRQLDVKPDVQVRRVFQRTGLIQEGATDAELVESARELAPDFPASLDASSWEIGRNWCRPKRPSCSECPLYGVCPQVGVPTNG
jgi:endonuclease III